MRANNIVPSTEVYTRRSVFTSGVIFGTCLPFHAASWKVGIGERCSAAVVLPQGCSWDLSVWRQISILLKMPLSLPPQCLLSALKNLHLWEAPGKLYTWSWWKEKGNTFLTGYPRVNRVGHVSNKIRLWIILSWTEEVMRLNFYMQQLKKVSGNICGSRDYQPWAFGHHKKPSKSWGLLKLSLP